METNEKPELPAIYEETRETPENVNQIIEHFFRSRSFQRVMDESVHDLWLRRSYQIVEQVCEEFSERDKSGSLEKLTEGLAEAREEPFRLLQLSLNRVFQYDQHLYLEIKDRVEELKRNGFEGDPGIQSREDLYKRIVAIRQDILISGSEDLPPDVLQYLQQVFEYYIGYNYSEAALVSSLSQVALLDQDLGTALQGLVLHCFERLKEEIYSIAGNYSYIMKEKASLQQGCFEIVFLDSGESLRVTNDKLFDYIWQGREFRIERIYKVARWQVRSGDSLLWVETDEFFGDSGLDQRDICDCELNVVELA